MSTLLIHPADPSTEFLGALYPENFQRVTEAVSGNGISRLLNHASRAIFLGHGTEAGLLAPDPNGNPFGRYIISESHRYYLRKIPEIIGIWCNANLFARKLGLHGLFSGMMISEMSEAQELGISTSQEELDRENKLWAIRLGDILWSDLPLSKIPDIFPTLDSSKTPLTNFNYKTLEYI